MLGVSKLVASVSRRKLALFVDTSSVHQSVDELCGQRVAIRFARRELCVNGVNSSPDWMKVSRRGGVLRFM